MKSAAFRLSLLGTALIVPLLALLAVSVARPSTVNAHPLGNFTVNRYSRLELYSDVIRVHYVLDMAEIPTFREVDAVDTDGDDAVSYAEKERYAVQMAEDIRGDLYLTANGSPSRLDLLSQELSFPPGQGGLDTLRLSLVFETPSPGSELAVEYRDENYADRIGWREIVVRPAEGVTLLESTAPTEDVTDELRTYPDDLLSSPLDRTLADGAPARLLEPAESAPERPGGAFVSLVSTSDLSLPVVMLALLAALGFGALHALEPGHGKTLVAAYFVGVKGTAKHALMLGLTIAATHTLGVLTIGLVTLYGSKFILPEQLYPWLSLASGLLVVGLGLRLLLSRLPSRNAHGHGHHHHHSHKRTDEDGSPLPWKGLVALGLADGLVPSPSTLVVLLAAISLDRIGLGFLLIVAFSVGLAAVLALVSLLLVYARQLLAWLGSRKWRLRQHPHIQWAFGHVSLEGRLLTALPVGGALVLVVVGLLLTARALSQPGLLGV